MTDNLKITPIVLFVYNRPWHAQQTVESLQRCELAAESDLYIFADGPKTCATEEQKAKISEVRKYIHTIDGFHSVSIEESETNKGLANSIIYGVTKVINKHDRVIVMEDDLIVSPIFLNFMNDALDLYQNDKRIYNIGGFNYSFPFPAKYQKDVYIVHRAESCGWGTWANRWNNVDWDISDAQTFFQSKHKQKHFNRGGDDMSGMLREQLEGKIDSWAIRWDYHLYKHNAYCLRPVKTLVNNIGFDGSGIHSGTMDTSKYTAEINKSSQYNIHLKRNIKEDRKVAKNFHDFWGVSQHITITKRIKRKIKKIAKGIFKSYNIS